MLNLRTQTTNGTLKLPQIGKLEADIVLADGSTYPYTGRIAFADASLSEQTGTYLIRAEVPNPKGTLRPGQFVRIKLRGADRANAIAVPQNAVIQGPRGAYVWTVDKDNKAQQRSIETGEWNGNDWVVSSGLHAGDRVVVDNTLRLMPGAPVNAHLVQAPAQAAQAGGAASGAAAPNGGNASEGAANGGNAAAAAGSANARGSTASSASGPTPLYFTSGSASLDAQSATALAAVAQRLAASPATRVVISGYTDSTGSAAQNERLAHARADTVRSALIVAGVQDARIEMRKPARVIASDPADKSRRVDVTLSPAAGG